MKTKEFLEFILLQILAFILGLAVANNIYALDRCSSLTTSVRIEHTKYFGLGFPFWYSVGQLKQESQCKSQVTAFDAGMGVAQFMPKTSTYIQSLMGEKLDPYNSKDAIRMQAYYMNRIHKKENWTKALFIDFQIYNGGAATLKKEYQRAGFLDWDLMKMSCQRKKVQYKWGILDNCEVNYDYSKKVEKYGNQYRNGPDSMGYWK